MPIALEVTLIVVLIALAAGLVPLLFQMRRTAQALDAFLLASKRDLSMIAEDVHASRLRMDHLTGTLQNSFDELLAFIRLLGEVGRTVKDFHTRYHSTIDSASRILGGITAAMSFFKKKHPPYNTHQE